MQTPHAAGVGALLALLVAQGLPVLARAEATWFLMGRHGECAPIGMLQRKFPDLGAVADPEAFVRFVTAKGLAVQSSRVEMPGGAAVDVRVPGQGLALLFVQGGTCAGGGAARGGNGDGLR